MRAIILILLALVSFSVRVEATLSNLPPVVNLQLENYAPTLPVHTVVTLQVQASDTDGAVQSISAHHNAATLGVIAGTNGSFTSTIVPGDNEFQAFAVDDAGATGASEIIRVTGNYPPTLRILEPASTIAIYSLSNSVTVRADASDLDGSITEVRLLANGTLLASDFQAPYEFLFKPATFGNYTLEVQAIDNTSGITSETRTVQYVRVIDNYAVGIPVSFGTNLTLRSTTVEATRQKGEPNHAGAAGGHSVWWAWRPNITGTVTIDTFGSDFDTVLGVYSNSLPFLSLGPITNLVTVAANDDDSANPPLSRVKFTAVANQTYYIAVDGRDGFAGNVVLNIRQTLSRTAPNDFIAAAVRIIGTTTQSSTNIGATKEPGEPMHAGNPGGASMWWRYEGFDTVPIQITTAGSTFDTTLAVYTNSTPIIRENNITPAMETLRLVTANDDAGNSTNRTSLVDFVPRPGTTYWIAVDGYNGAEGNIRLAITRQSQVTRPSNDFFSAAAVLRGSSALTNANTFLASSEFGEPAQIAPKTGGKSVWYRWIAPATGPVFLSTKWSDFDTILGVYVGTNITGLFYIASNDDDGGLQTSALVFTAIAGTEYRIAVAGYQNAGGDLVLTLNQPPLLLPRMITTFNAGRIALTVTDLGGTFLLESSPDLTNWTTLRTLTAEEATLEIDPDTQLPQQFYRLRQLDY
jgi:hypothetical protein